MACIGLSFSWGRDSIQRGHDKMELKRKHVITFALLLVLVLGTAGFLNLPADVGNYDINDYGILTMKSGGSAVSSLETIVASDGLVVEWESTVSVAEINAWLYTTAGINLEEGAYTKNDSTHVFTFSLDGAPEGTTEIYVAFGGQYTQEIAWYGSSPHIFVEQDAIPSYPALEFTVEPNETTYAQVGESVSLRWDFVYTGPATARVTVNGVTKSSRALTQTTSPQPYTFTTAFSEAGTYKVKMIVEPKYDIAYASEVSVIVAGSTNITTTTETTTNTTTTTTEIPDTGFTTLILAVVLFGALLVVAVFQIKMRED